MFSFDQTREGKSIAIIRNGKLKNEVVYMKDPQLQTKRGEWHNAIELNSDMGSFEVIPSADPDQRDLVYVCGRSGSGKSTWTRSYIINYLRQFPQNKCYVFSQVEEDKAFDDLKRVYRVIIDGDIVNEETGQCNIGTEELKNSLVVLDDIDTISDKKILNAIYELENRILETGRHFKIFVVRTSHLITNYKRSRTILNESSKIVLFLNGCPSGSTRGYLRVHHGMGTKEIKRLYDIKSRWVMISNTYPTYFMGQHCLYSQDALSGKDAY